MNSTESTYIVYGRIQKIEPEFVNKIVGYLLLRDNGEREMIRLASSPDNVILAITNETKIEMGLVHSNKQVFHPQYPSRNQCYDDPIAQEYYLQLHHQMQLLRIDEQTHGKRYSSKVCHYFMRGHCKHGISCRYVHNEVIAEDQQMFSPRSLEKLEFELTELLRSRNGVPVSIALLPMLYYEKFGRTLQAEGYLTESQRHGKAGYSLTKLLIRMRPRIHIIERAHGQHSVVLAEDLPKYIEYTNEYGCLPIGARQIYLTFPAESVFSEQDVSNYFSGFGPVEDVRIPCQQKRMFGFVTFLFTETVRKILAKGNPHFVCGARVLVKPYKEKSRLADRNTAGRKNAANFCLHYINGIRDPSIQTNSESRLVRKRLMEEQEQTLEVERRLSELQTNSYASLCYSTPGSTSLSEVYGEEAEFPAPNGFSFLLDVLEDEYPNEVRAKCTSSSNYNDQQSVEGLDLPESPFGNAKANAISTAT